MRTRGPKAGISIVGGLVFFLWVAAALQAQSPADTTTAEIKITTWFLAGPVEGFLPVFGDTLKAIREKLPTTEYLDFDKLWPQAGKEIAWSPGQTITWQSFNSPDGKPQFPIRSDAKSPHVAYAACYLASPRWQKVKLVVTTGNLFALYLDGEEKAKQTAVSKAAKDTVETSAELVLTQGKHRLVIQTVFDPRDSLAFWSLSATFRVPKEKKVSAPQVSLDPKHAPSLDDLVELESISELAISQDATKLAVVKRFWKVKDDKSATYLEIRALPSGQLLQTQRMGDGVSTPVWSPDGERLAFQAPGDKEGNDLWLLEITSGRVDRLIAGEKGLGNVIWAPDGKFIYFSSTEPKPEQKDQPAYERLNELYERWNYWKDKSHLNLISVVDKTRHHLTTGEYAIDDAALSPDGKKLALVRSVPIPERPFFATELWLFDPGARTEEKLANLRRQVGHLVWSPDGSALALSASVGEVTGDTSAVEHNNYNYDLFLLSLSDRNLKNLTLNFDPHVGAALTGASDGRSPLWWSAQDKKIHFLATNRGRVNLYRVDPAKPGIVEPLNLPFPVSSGTDVARNGRDLVFIGSSPTQMPQVYHYDLQRKKSTQVLTLNGELTTRLVLGKVEPWDFTNARGTKIDGWIYYPTDFAPDKKYPLVVYYYGGVFPNGEAFGFTYHWWNAHGYLVYVLNPVGAVGYGQKFADLHVNDWGELAAADIIEGVQKLSREKPCIDSTRVGAYGGSYGGFMTMTLATKTKLFGALCSMYGIADITSYWGEGWWGYLYSDVATAKSYPWNRKDVYIARSPLYNADKITTPLLLLHGTGDTNVPPGESEQMFTALKILKQDVAYVRFPGEGHGISNKLSNYLSHRQMMLEWFDKYLKDQPEGWEERWKKK